MGIPVWVFFPRGRGKPWFRGKPRGVSFCPRIAVVSVIPERSFPVVFPPVVWKIPFLSSTVYGWGKIPVIVTDSVMVFVCKKGALPVFRVCPGFSPGCGGGFSGKKNCPYGGSQNYCKKFFHSILLKVFFLLFLYHKKQPDRGTCQKPGSFGDAGIVVSSVPESDLKITDFLSVHK